MCATQNYIRFCGQEENGLNWLRKKQLWHILKINTNATKALFYRAINVHLYTTEL